jgi:hypothetical protein
MASTCDKMSIVSTKRSARDNEKAKTLGVAVNMYSQPEIIREALGVEPLRASPTWKIY